MQAGNQVVKMLPECLFSFPSSADLQGRAMRIQSAEARETPLLRKKTCSPAKHSSLSAFQCDPCFQGHTSQGNHQELTILTITTLRIPAPKSLNPLFSQAGVCDSLVDIESFLGKHEVQQSEHRLLDQIYFGWNPSSTLNRCLTLVKLLNLS